MSNQETGFVPYEYMRVDVNPNSEPMYKDIYENFGWQAVGAAEMENRENQANRKNSNYRDGDQIVTLNFRRERNIKNRSQIQNLQRKCEKILLEIGRLEREKTDAALIASLGVGVVGGSAVAGAVFSGLAGLMLLTIPLAVVGAAGIAAPYYLYMKIRKSKEEQLDPKIEEEFEKIYLLCEQARKLWV